MQYNCAVATTELIERGSSNNFIANSLRPDGAHVSNHLAAYILGGPNVLGNLESQPHGSQLLSPGQIYPIVISSKYTTSSWYWSISQCKLTSLEPH